MIGCFRFSLISLISVTSQFVLVGNVKGQFFEQNVLQLPSHLPSSVSFSENFCCRCSANPCKKGETQARSRQCLDRSQISVLPPHFSRGEKPLNNLDQCRVTGEEVDLSACSGRGQRRAGDRIEIEPCFCF